MDTTEEIKKKFLELPGGSQELLLDELSIDFETRGQVLENVEKEKKGKPDRTVQVRKSISVANNEACRCTKVEPVPNGIVKQPAHLYGI